MFNSGELTKFQEFVSGLKEGDSWTKVYSNWKWRDFPDIFKIQFVKKTQTQIVVRVRNAEQRYRLTDGRIVGGGYDTFPMPSTPEEIKNAESTLRTGACKREIEGLVSELKNVTDELALMQIKELMKSAIAKKV